MRYRSYIPIGIVLFAAILYAQPANAGWRDDLLKNVKDAANIAKGAKSIFKKAPSEKEQQTSQEQEATSEPYQQAAKGKQTTSEDNDSATSPSSNRRIIGLPKAPQSKEYISTSKPYGPFNIHLVHNPLGSKDGDFLLSISYKENYQTNISVSFNSSSYDSCAQLMSVRVLFWPEKFNFDRFFQTDKVEDLPPLILEAMYLTLNVLFEQCDELKAVRFNLVSMASNFSELKSDKFTGLPRGDNRWDIQKGFVKTAVDNTRKLKLRFRDPYYAAGIEHDCVCEKNAILPLKQVNYTNQFKAFPEDIKVSMTEYKSVAKTISKKYFSECPSTEKISFSLNPIPEGYTCTDKSPCYLTWNSQNQSEINSEQFSIEPDEPMLYDYNDVINAFAQGNYKLLDQYEGYIRFFHNDFLEIYFENCGENIKNPVAIDIKTIETRYNSDGFIESQNQVGETYRIYIDSRYADRFDRFYGLNQLWGAKQLMKKVLKQSTAGAVVSRMQMGLNSFIHERNLIKSFLSGQCSGKKAQVVYENLDRYYRHIPPLEFEE